MENSKIPFVNFKTRFGKDWIDKNTNDLFQDKRVLLFALPGAFTPTCSTKQLPNFERLYEEFKKKGIDEVYCLSVNDAFVMNNWADASKVRSVKMIPDGSGNFTRQMGMLVNKDNIGFGMRSWRYAMIVNDRHIEQMFIEPGKEDNCESDPYDVSNPENILSKL